jgi:hypothetical protein
LLILTDCKKELTKSLSSEINGEHKKAAHITRAAFKKSVPYKFLAEAIKA